MIDVIAMSHGLADNIFDTTYYEMLKQAIAWFIHAGKTKDGLRFKMKDSGKCYEVTINVIEIDK